MKTYPVLARTHEDRLTRQHDEAETDKDRDGERRPCVLGPGPECAFCPRRIRERCEE